MKIGKKASVKAIRACQKIAGESKKLPLTTSWEECWDILSDAHKSQMSVETDKDYKGGKTIITVHFDGAEDIRHEMPSAEYFDTKAMDWNWNNIYKLACETLMKRKAPKAPKAKKPSRTEINSRLAECAAYSRLLGKDQKEIRALKEPIDLKAMEESVEALRKASVEEKNYHRRRAIIKKKLPYAEALLEAWKFKNELLTK